MLAPQLLLRQCCQVAPVPSFFKWWLVNGKERLGGGEEAGGGGGEGGGPLRGKRRDPGKLGSASDPPPLFTLHAI